MPNPFPGGSEEAARFEYVVAQLGYRPAEPSRLRKRYTRAVGSGDYEIAEERESVVRFSREMRQRSPLYKAFVKRLALRVVGADGLYPREVSGSRPSAAAAAGFRAWARGRGVDAAGRCGWPALLRLMVEEAAVGGDVLVNRVGGLDGPGTVQLIESERVANPSRGANTKTMRNGVTVDEMGRPVAYTVLPWIETGSVLDWGRPQELSADHADLFALDVERVGQSRGMPLLTQALTRIADLEEVHENITVAMKLAAIFAVVMKTKAPEHADRSLAASTRRAGGGGSSSGPEYRNVFDAEPGQMLSLGLNEEFETVKGENPPSGYGEWNGVENRAIAAAGGLPVEVGMGDFSSANFSQARMANMFAEETAAPIRDHLVTCVCETVYRWWAAGAVLRGEIPRDTSSPDGVPPIAGWTRPPEIEYDRLTGLKAAQLAINENLSTQSIEARKRGEDPEEILAKRAEEKAYMIEKGIVPPSVPGAKVVIGEDAGGETGGGPGVGPGGGEESS